MSCARIPFLAAALALALVPAAESARASKVASCAPAGVVVWLDTREDAAAGSSYVNLEVTNLSRSSCALRGYPGVSGVDLTGRQLGTAAARNPAAPARTIVLAPGSTATSLLRITHVGVFPAGACGPVLAAGLRVYLPDTTQSKLVPFPFRACSRAGRAYLAVQTLAKG